MEQDIHIDFLSGGGQLGGLIREYDWSKTSLGPLDEWSLTLTTTIGLMLSSPVPIVTLWGDDGVMIYNDAYAVVAGGRHPGLLGQPVREGWPEVSGFNDRVMRMVLAGGVLSYRDQEMMLNRSGQPERVWLNLDYSPIYDAEATPVGVFSVVVETTPRVLAERDLRAEEAAREAERRRQRKLFEEAPGFILILRGPEHIVEFVNLTHQRLFNSKDWVGKRLCEVALNSNTALLDQVYATGQLVTAQGREVSRLPYVAEGLRYVTFMCAPLYDDAGTITGLFCEGFDVTNTEALRRREAALSELSLRISETEDADELARIAAEIAAQVLGANRVGFGRVDQGGERVDMQPDWTAPDVPSLEGPLMLKQFGPALPLLQRGETLVVEDTETDPRRSSEGRDMLEALKIRSMLAVPVMEQGRLVAIVSVTDNVPRRWTAEEIAFTGQVMQRTRNGIERRRAETRLRRNEATLRFLDRLGQSIGGLSSAEDILTTVTRLLGEQLGVANCAYADVDEDADDVWIRSEWLAPNGPDLSIVGRYRLKQFGPTCARTLLAGQPFVIRDMAADLPPEERKAFEGLRLGALITLPLVKEGRLTALMAVHETRPRDWSADDLALMREVTERSWAHVERARAEGERREAERRLRAALEAKVTERSAALLQARKSEALGRLAGGVAHDFNNLLTAVMGNLEMLGQRVQAEPRVQSMIDNAMTAATRGASLTRRLQRFATRQVAVTERVDLRRLIDGMRELIARTLGPMLTIETSLEAGLPPVKTNPQELEAALVDLLLRARDASAGLGSIRLVARYAEDAPTDLRLESRSYVCVSVRDTGRHLDAPISAEEAGLAMVHTFAQETGGALRLISHGDEGATAELWLPAAS